jgi:ABC-type transport system involved in Fe-S cluster assembly fused permease/ATPase subunit
MAGRTTLVIAHRLSTIISADRVVMLDRGQVVASGRHADLVAADGPYAQLIAAQRRHT